MPTIPGRYRVTLGLAEIGHRTIARSFRTMTLDVVAPYAASFAVPKQATAVAGQALSLKITVANVGTVDWRTPVVPVEGSRPVIPVTQTQLVLSWRSDRGDVVPAAEVPAEIAPGHSAKLIVPLVAPADAGTWTLDVDLANMVEGAMSSTGRDVPSIPVLVTPMVLADGS